MAASKLSIYKGACLAIGERMVMSLTEEVPARRELDGVWDRNGLRTCLQSAQWNFATRGIQLEYSPSITPAYGYARAFEKPEDFVRLANICSDEYFRVPLTQFEDEAGYWFADIDTIYVRYVSDSDDYGKDFAKWPENFTRYVENHFAFEICNRVTGSRANQDVEKDRRHWLDLAKGTDSAEEPARELPRGTWSESRRGNRSRSRGSRGLD